MSFSPTVEGNSVRINGRKLQRMSQRNFANLHALLEVGEALVGLFYNFQEENHVALVLRCEDNYLLSQSATEAAIYREDGMYAVKVSNLLEYCN